MLIEHKTFETEAQWLEFRSHFISSTESPALFNKGKWCTLFKLWHLKKGTLEDDFKENAKTKSGKKMEDVIAELYAEKTGRHVEEIPEYRFSRKHGLGASYDKMTIDEEGSKHILEIKNLEWRTIAEWEDGEPDYQYLIQCQTQLALYPEMKSAILCCFVNGWDLKQFVIERDEAFIAALLKKSLKFWESIEKNIEPEIDLDSAEAAKKVYSTWKDTAETATPEIERMIMEMQMHSESIKSDENQKKLLQAQIMASTQAGTLIMSNGQRLDMKFQADTPATLITTSMVGQAFGGRKGYRRCQIRGKAK